VVGDVSDSLKFIEWSSKEDPEDEEFKPNGEKVPKPEDSLKRSHGCIRAILKRRVPM